MRLNGVLSLSAAVLIFPFTIIFFTSIMGSQDNPLPGEFDWREKGILTPVKGQGNCGSCGEFAGVAVLEALIKWKTGELVDLSEQQIVSCVEGCGCNVGCSSLEVMKYIKENGIALEEEFPYKGKDIPCDKKLSGKYFFSEVHSTTIGNKPLEERIKTIKEAVMKHGPVATNMTLYDDLDRYKSGVYRYDVKAKEMGGHWIVIVGWKDDPNLPSGGYWICRNTWGEKWGQKGYFYSAYGDKTGVDNYYFVYGTYNSK